MKKIICFIFLLAKAVDKKIEKIFSSLSSEEVQEMVKKSSIWSQT